MSALLDVESAAEIGPPLSGPNFHFIPKEGSTNLVIYFSGTGKTNGRFDFWGGGRQIEEHLLFVSDGRNHWYQEGVPGLGNTIEETVDAIKAYCLDAGITKITTVGASMGGYAAILYAAFLGAQALAFSFDSVLKLPTSPSEKHMPAAAPVHHPDIVPIVERTGTRVHIYVGEMYPMDLVGALRLKHLPTVTMDSLRGVGHETARFVQQVAKLTNVLPAFVYGRPLPRMREVGTILENPELVAILHRAHLHFRGAEYAACIQVCRDGLVVNPYLEALHLLLGRCYLLRKKTQLAVRHLSLVAAALPDFEDGQFYYAHAIRLGGSNFAAEDHFSRQAKKWPRSARVLYNLAKAQEAIGADREARSNMKKAVALEPAYKVRFREMIERLKQHEETEARPLIDLPSKVASRPVKAIPHAKLKPKSRKPTKPKKPRTLYQRARTVWRNSLKLLTGAGK